MKKFLPALVLVLLAVALLGWVWMFRHLLLNERAVAEAREREWVEAYLAGVGERFEEGVKNAVRAGLADWARVAEEGGRLGDVVDGVVETWVEREQSVPWAGQGSFAEWQAKGEPIGVEEYLRNIESKEWKLGAPQDGRDAVAAVGLGLLREASPESGRLWDLLFARATTYNGYALRPGFRLLMLRELEATGELAGELREQWNRVYVWETFRAVEGRGEELPEEAQGVVVEASNSRVLLLDERLASLLQSAANGPEVEFVDEERLEVGRPMVRVQVGAEERWIGAREGVGMPGYGQSERVMMWVGGASGLLLLVGGTMAVWVARVELKLARLRTDLAASVAHELRTPLAGQRLLLETLLERGDQPEGEQREYLEMAYRENRRLGRLAEEFLTFSRLDRGVLSLEEEVVRPASAVRAAVETLREKWEDPNCHLVVEVDEDLPAVRADEQALVTALRNLLENAWKYTGERKEISVTGRESDGGVFLEVRDNGVGLAAADRERIFRQFYRVDQRLSRDQGGLGLGLAIVKRLVVAMDGRVEVESEAGTGSAFRIWLPRVS